MIIWSDIGKEFEAIALLSGGGEHIRKLDFLPTSGDYYITDKGDVFSVRRCKNKCAITRQEGRIRNQGFFSYTRFGNRSSSYPIARAVYRAFVGAIRDDEKLEFIDGDRHHPVVTNLKKMPSSAAGAIQGDNLFEHIDEYISHFDYVVSRIRSRFDIPREDARDIAQEAFISSAVKWKQKGRPDIPFGRFWTKEASFYTRVYFQRRNLHPTTKLEYDVPVEFEEYNETEFVEKNLSRIDAIILRYTSYGYTPAELARILKMSSGAVRSRKHLAVKKLKKVLQIRHNV